jgi:trigger factor
LDKNLAGPKFTLIVITMPQVVLGDYAQIRIKKEEVKVEDKEVDDMLAQLQRQRATFKIVERPIIKGDLAEIDFEGLIDGKPMEGGVSKNHPLIVGDGLFVAGFEENLIGLKKGDEKTFEITFPADFAKAELAGKKGAFTVKVNAVKEVNLPSLDNAFAQLFGQPDLAALSNDIKKFIQSQKENELAKKYQDTLIDELIAGSKIELPAELVEEEVHSMLEEAKEQAAHLKLTWPEYLARSQQTEQSFHEQLYKLAERRIKAGLIIDQIGNLEKIGVSPEEVEHEISRIKQSSPEQEKEVEAIYQKGTAARRRLEIALTGQKTLNTLLQKVLL